MEKEKLTKIVEELMEMGNDGYFHLIVGNEYIGPADTAEELTDMVLEQSPELLNDN